MQNLEIKYKKPTAFGTGVNYGGIAAKWIRFESLQAFCLCRCLERAGASATYSGQERQAGGGHQMSGAFLGWPIHSQNLEIKYKKPTAFGTGVNYGGIAAKWIRFESLQAFCLCRCMGRAGAPATYPGQEQRGGGIKSLHPFGVVTARVSRTDFFWLREV